MFKVKIKKSDYEFLMNVSQTILEAYVEKIEVIEDDVILFFESYSVYDRFEANYNSAIVHFGMVNQDYLNETGEVMQKIYDEIVEQ